MGLTLETLLEKSLGLKSEGAMGDMRRRRICLSPLVKETTIRLPKIEHGDWAGAVPPSQVKLVQVLTRSCELSYFLYCNSAICVR